MADELLQIGKRGAPAPAPIARPGAPKVYIETYGCQMNVADSDVLGGILAGAGYARAERVDDADVVIINTCAVREKAEERVTGRVAELTALKKKRGDFVLAIAGCMAEHLKDSLAERAPCVDVIAGPDTYRRMPSLLEAARHREAGAPVVLDVELDKRETYEGLSGAVGGDGVSGFVTIQRGCDKFCTFCVVPFTRGRERGTSPREILRQARELADAGYKEIVLLGQTVNSYRWEDDTFAQLLRAVAQVDGLERVRFTSPYPVDFTDDVVEVIATEPKICKYVHLPLQSGSDAVLARMRRGYTVDDFRAIVGRLRAACPDIAFSTDILSGFSGETREDHEATLAVMRELRFDSAFMFAYSERDLTFAAKKLPDDVSPDEKRRRLVEIVTLQEQIGADVFSKQIGKRERVLVHGPSRRDAQQMMGRTDGFKTVILPRGLGAPGDMVDVTIERATMATLFGVP
ncbi:MAG TPA: tRNA (N6-isopentenyl adenosine(37)-C2)-methylthiotransferase MiaB [Kofleriaceae bacterium]|nr:tRNA (N6-isopentenyl adenosine(37)-C2)-methylthiotransferase MiaB [Kofleriaceae bacterium]